MTLSPKVNEWVSGRLELSCEVDVALKDALTLRRRRWNGGGGGGTVRVGLCLVKLTESDESFHGQRETFLSWSEDWHRQAGSRNDTRKQNECRWLTTREEDREATSRSQCMGKLSQFVPHGMKSFYDCPFLRLLHHSVNTALLDFLWVLNGLPPPLSLFCLQFSLCLVLSLDGWKRAWNLSHIPNNYYHRKWSWGSRFTRPAN